jgi:hypothetical protein
MTEREIRRATLKASYDRSCMWAKMLHRERMRGDVEHSYLVAVDSAWMRTVMTGVKIRNTLGW